MIALLFGMAMQAAAPSAEAESLGRQLAEAGTLATLVPLVTAGETEDLIKAHLEWSDDDKAELRATAKAVAAQGTDRLLGAEGHAYATTLSIDDLRVLVAAANSDAAKRHRAALPAVIASTMGAAGTFDFKRETLAAFCRKTGKACAK